MRFVLLTSALFCLLSCALAMSLQPTLKAQEAAAEKKEALPETFKLLMKAVGKQKLLTNKSIKTKNAPSLKKVVKQMELYASKALEKDDQQERKTADDYKTWMADFEKEAGELKTLADQQNPDWDKLSTQYDKVIASCETCHKKYHKDDDK